MYVEDLILLSGGFLISSNQEDVTINRLELDPLNERIVRKFNVQIDKDYLLGLKDKPDNGFILEHKDIVVVKQKSSCFLKLLRPHRNCRYLNDLQHLQVLQIHRHSAAPLALHQC